MLPSMHQSSVEALAGRPAAQLWPDIQSTVLPLLSSLQTRAGRLQGALGRSWGLRLLRGASMVLLLTALVAMWGRHVAWVPERATWPVTRWLRTPHSRLVAGADAVMIVPWIAVCRRASAALASALTCA